MNYEHEEQDSQDFQDEYKLWRKLESIENGLNELEGTIRDFAGKQAKRREHFIPTNAPYKPNETDVFVSPHYLNLIQHSPA